MMRSWRSSLGRYGVWLAGTTLLVAGALRAENDRVTKAARGEVIEGTVKKADLGGVEIEVKDKRTNMSATVALGAAEISDIEWDVGMPEWRAGMSAFDSASYTQAAQHFQGILTEPEDLQKVRGAAKPALYYYAAESLYRSGKLADAMPVFEKLMNEYKTSYYVPRAVGSIVDAAIQTKEFAKVPPLLSQLRQLGGEQKPLADYYEGQMWMAQGKITEAQKLFLAAAGSSNVPATKGMALMGQAQCAIAANSHAKGRDLALRALAAGPPPSVAGAAHLTIGDALLAEVDAQKPVGQELQNKLMDALLEYMRVIEQYRGDPRTEPQAMLRAGDCLVRLGTLPNRGADRFRALYMYNKLTNDPRYRASRWAAQAAEAVKNLR